MQILGAFFIPNQKNSLTFFAKSIIIVVMGEKHMAKIYQFPNMRDKKQLESQMIVLQDSMLEIYDAIRKVDMGLTMLQKQSEDLEDTYQQLVQSYANIVGTENVASEWLEYCTFVGMDRDPKTGKVTIYFKPPEGEEE